MMVYDGFAIISHEPINIRNVLISCFALGRLACGVVHFGRMGDGRTVIFHPYDLVNLILLCMCIY